MRRVETIFKIITFFTAGVFFIINLHLPIENWIWQLMTMYWVGTCFYKSRKIEHLQIEKKFKK